jgi:hypothetical protein
VPTVEVVVVYYDRATGGAWQLKYDSQDQPGKPMSMVHTEGSGVWKEVTYTINDAHFGRRGAAASDLSLHMGECASPSVIDGGVCPDVVVAQVEVRLPLALG